MGFKVVGGVLFSDAPGETRVADGTSLTPASIRPSGVVTVAAVATANATDLATAQALANALKTSHNALLTQLKAGGYIPNA